MDAVTLTRVCPCDGQSTIVGVFESMDAAIQRLRLLSTYADVGEEYKLEIFHMRALIDETKNTEEVLTSRAEYKAKQERDQEESESSEA